MSQRRQSSPAAVAAEPGRPASADRDPRLIEQIAEEAGATVGGTLYSDALASAGPASTYLGMFEHNLDTLMQALQP